MRIAIVSWTARQVGGAERYLANLVPALERAGHEIAMLIEMDVPDREPIPLREGSPVWSVAAMGLPLAIDALRGWRPDVVFTHVTLAPEVEGAAQAVAPAVFFAHAYYGTCISGAKTKKFPRPVACDRVFGPGCLLNYYPRRCGGLNPLTMIADYRKQTFRHQLLGGYRYVLTGSEHMRREFIRNGVVPERAGALPMPILEVGTGQGTPLAAPLSIKPAERHQPQSAFTEAAAQRAVHGAPGKAGGIEQSQEYGKAESLAHPAGSAHVGQVGVGEKAVREGRSAPAGHAGTPAGEPVTLLFIARMERLKGGALAMDALPAIRRGLDRPVRLVAIGDGPDRADWEERARAVVAADPAINVEFTGWIARGEIERRLAAADLLLVPSIWPEPFGMVGPEAGAGGVPAIAFAVGGIADWLTEGVNGHFASGRTPTAKALAQAAVRALADPAHHAKLRRGAYELAQRFTLDAHVRALEPYLMEAARIVAASGRRAVR